MHVPFNRDLPSPLSGLWSYNLGEKKDLYEIIKLFVKEHLPSCIPARGPLTAATSGPLYCNVLGRWWPDIPLLAGYGPISYMP